MSLSNLCGWDSSLFPCLMSLVDVHIRCPYFVSQVIHKAMRRKIRGPLQFENNSPAEYATLSGVHIPASVISGRPLLYKNKTLPSIRSIEQDLLAANKVGTAICRDLEYLSEFLLTGGIANARWWIKK